MDTAPSVSDQTYPPTSFCNRIILSEALAAPKGVTERALTSDGDVVLYGPGPASTPVLHIAIDIGSQQHNAHAILRDFRALKDKLWQRFSVEDPEEHLWYYKSLLEVYSKRIDNWMVDELREVIDALQHEVCQSA